MFLKNNKPGLGYSSVVESLPSMQEALGLVSNTKKKKKKKRQKNKTA
jgi:hypothetical protein